MTVRVARASSSAPAPWWRPLVPGLLTACGSVAFVLWFAGGSAWWAIASLAFDVADGWTARRLQARTRFGAIYDWTVDTTAAAAIATRFAPASLPLLVLFQAAARRMRWRVSGRAALTLAALAWGAWHS